MAVTLSELSEAIALIHEAALEPARWSDVLQRIVALLGGSRVALMDIEAGSGRLLELLHQGHDPAHARLYAEHFYAIDPTLETALSWAPLKAATVYEQFPKRLRDRHEYFDFARRCDIGDVIGVATHDVGRARTALSLQRPLRGRAYGSEEKQILELLAPHLQIAKRVQTRLGEAGAASAQLDAALGRLALPCLIVDAGGKIRHLNDAARTLLQRCEGIASRQARLVFAEPRGNSAFCAALREATSPVGRSAAFHVRLGAEELVEVLVAPLRPHHPHASGWGAPVAIVAINPASRDESSIAARLRRLHGLTAAEARLTAGLAVGRSVAQIAAAHRVSQATIRSQLRSAFAKTRTSRQAELVALALSGGGLRLDD